ncbi:Protein of unknown function [Amycolatopsis arida]|uniref:DUF2505 domain-containing protein n=1 Tax=Amycolatopsis arida TaxID=587909 RepID=A0A1I5YB00_9PSEU|nr:DUF2505 domain-containing protein [Amycolatopsis arida]TDX90395.1 uncharacterized protein DUF2505 [Amycolatopsis arida]SFQ41368.1 Protein of unknown function [Amycolatopsis arida]
MGSRIEHRAEFRRSVADVYRAEADEAALRDRLAELGGRHAELSAHAETPDGVRYRLVQGIDADHLPSAVRAVHKGDLVVHREQEWHRAGDGYAGTARAGVDGVPGRIEARTEITAEGDVTVLRATGEVTVRIPLLGGKLERLIAEQVTTLLRREAEFTARWLDRDG